MEDRLRYGYVPGAWIEALHHEPRSNPLYKPALLLAVLDAICPFYPHADLLPKAALLKLAREPGRRVATRRGFVSVPR